MKLSHFLWRRPLVLPSVPEHPVQAYVSPVKDVKLTSYCQKANYHLSTYATDYIISKTNADITNCKKLQDIDAVHH